MRFTKDTRRLFMVVISALYFAAGLIAAQRIIAVVAENNDHQNELQFEQQVAVFRSNLESAIYNDIYLAASFATLVTVKPSIISEQWDTFAEAITRQYTDITSISVYPNDVISYVYPLTGNESALGLDFRNLPKQYKIVEKARETQNVVISSPFTLVQGGTAIAIRIPIFADYPQNNDYWGGISLLINYDLHLQQAMPSGLPPDFLAIQDISNPLSPQLYWGNPAIPNTATSSLPVRFPGGEWLLSARYEPSAAPKQTLTVNIIRYVSYGLIILVYLMVLLLYRAFVRTRRLAYQDELTKLANRRYVMKKLHEQVEQPSNKKDFAVLLMDVNKFKSVNDAYGHDAGDKLLKFIAHGLKDMLRTTDTVARLGGDEFLVLLSRIKDEAAIAKVISTIQDYFANNRFEYKQHSMPVSLSIGYAMANNETTEISELLHAADQVMYANKQATR
ncbi:diguanylate cyclase domain-containing protein [Bowmanella sp. JS7-9]|uniref:Diguanylate cyclase domain-containing protein n=1 Tax=Pseudobowmanella zhangzhouensis TaxID=1537679 RepID=A0ABW1XQK0_9ALTE|nr:diguanylate cyclase [Bowmanella sp. JS7-9]TBX23694.1 hypothetical protein TK45_06215 [Bowmanella sp. JS7-9]